jgi:hypothetical protein
MAPALEHKQERNQSPEPSVGKAVLWLLGITVAAFLILMGFHYLVDRL